MSVREQLPEDGLDIGDGRRVWESRSGPFYISADGALWPGIYNTFEAAERAFEIDPNLLWYRQSSMSAYRYKVSHGNPITLFEIEHFLKAQ